MFLIFSAEALFWEGCDNACRMALNGVNGLKLKWLSWFFVGAGKAGRATGEHF